MHLKKQKTYTLRGHRCRSAPTYTKENQRKVSRLESEKNKCF